MSIVITANYTSNASGAGVIVAKGAGRQKTTRIDLAKSPDANFGSAVGALLNVLTDDRQQGMLRHPSGAQRVKVERLSGFGGKQRFTIEV